MIYFSQIKCKKFFVNTVFRKINIHVLFMVIVTMLDNNVNNRPGNLLGHYFVVSTKNIEMFCIHVKSNNTQNFGLFSLNQFDMIIFRSIKPLRILMGKVYTVVLYISRHKNIHFQERELNNYN